MSNRNVMAWHGIGGVGWKGFFQQQKNLFGEEYIIYIIYVKKKLESPRIPFLSLFLLFQEWFVSTRSFLETKMISVAAKGHTSSSKYLEHQRPQGI